MVFANDYYPFGMAMPERSFDSPKYRYGFNGKEKDESGEWGSLTHYDYGFRIYNPGVGRFLSVDPLSPEYPELTPYQFASNSPIAAIDIDGLEAFSATFSTFSDGRTQLDLLYDDNLDPINQPNSFYIFNNKYGSQGELVESISSTGKYEDYPTFFGDPDAVRERSDKKGLFTITGELELTYGGIVGEIKLLGSRAGLELGGEQTLIGYDGVIFDSDSKFSQTLDGFKAFDRGRPFDVGGGGSFIVGAKHTAEFSNVEGYTGLEKIELDNGLFTTEINSNNERTNKIGAGIHLQVLFGVKANIEVGINSKPIPSNLFLQQMGDRFRSEIQQDNTTVNQTQLFQE